MDPVDPWSHPSEVDSRAGASVAAGVDERVWRIVEDATAASFARDGASLRAHLHRLHTEVSNGKLAYYYFLFLVEWQILMAFGHRPDEAEVAGLAVARRDHFSSIVPRSEVLEPTYRRVMGFSYPDAVAGIEFLIYLAAALGGLVRDPRSDLAVHKAELARRVKSIGVQL